MTFTNTQTTELSLDQLDDISAGFGFFKVAVKTASAAGKLAAKSGLRTGLKNVVRVASQSVPTSPIFVNGVIPAAGLIGYAWALSINRASSSQGHTGQ